MKNNELNFTDTQKEAAIYGLYQIARSDTDFDNSEFSFVQRIGESLGELFDHLSISNLVVRNASKQLTALKSFSKSQKEWFVMSSFSLINSDKRLLDEEFNVVNGFFRAMNISREDAKGLVANMKGEIKCP